MIQVEDLCFNVGSFSLREIHLSVASNEYFVLLGPTGSGKSLFLKCLCGLLRVRRGKIVVDGQDVTHVEPRRRQIGYVPQDCGLFPHLDVAHNVTFSLQARGMSYRRALKEVEALIEILGLRPLLHRSPAGLSGGERQKVALGRALAPRPKLLLLDEPVSALDELSRQQVCAELRRVQRDLQVTTIHVSHNLEEALSVSDRAGILHQGRLLQTGPLSDMLRKPRNETVARFLRNQNIFEGRAEAASEGGAIVSFAGGRIRLQERCEGNVRFILRPELLRIDVGGEPTMNSIPACLRGVADRGAYVELKFETRQGIPIVVYASPDGSTARLVPMQTYSIIFPPESVHVLEE